VSDEQNLNLKLIGDGEIKYTGDISKCLVYADAVMIGWIIAGTSETPGNVYQDPDGKFYKVYAGSASGESKNSNGQKVKFIEGMTQTVPFRGKVKYILIKIKENLQSAMSYAGAQNMEEFKNKAQLKAITFAGQIESKI
jgi:IMP dehydrogenase